MTQHLYIGIVGKKQSGKDTVGRLLANELYSLFTPIRIAFADGVKDEVCKLLGCDLKKLEENKGHPTVRNLLQYHGTEYCRQTHGLDYWLKQADKKIESYMEKFQAAILSTTNPTVPKPKPYLFYFTDCRFLNEADYIKDKGGILLKVERDLYDINDKHASETEQDKISPDFHVNNHNGLSMLELEIRGCTVPKIKNWINKQSQLTTTKNDK